MDHRKVNSQKNPTYRTAWNEKTWGDRWVEKVEKNMKEKKSSRKSKKRYA